MLFALTNQLPWGWLGFERWHIAALPAGWYDANLFWLGLPDLTRFSSADYFPILPWVFLFWCGLFLVYMLHQPVIYGILWLWTSLRG